MGTVDAQAYQAGLRQIGKVKILRQSLPRSDLLGQSALGIVRDHQHGMFYVDISLGLPAQLRETPQR